MPSTVPAGLLINGTKNSDKLSGGAGNDTLNGLEGKDTIYGGGGNDLIDGGLGSDFISAGDGDDVIIYDQTDYKVVGGTGIDTLSFTGTRQTVNFGTQDITSIEKLVLGGGGGHSVTFSAADVLRVSDNARFVISGSAGNNITFSDLTTNKWSWTGLVNGNQSLFSNGSVTVIADWDINVAGFSNNAVITATGSRTVTEDVPITGPLLAGGTITVTDTNSGQAQLRKAFLGTALTGSGKLATDQTTTNFSIGTLTITDKGSGVYQYSYNVDNSKVQFLGKTPWIDQFKVQAIDGKTETLVFTINGLNDAPTGTATSALAGGTEDQPYNVTAADLLQGFSDVDKDTLTVTNLTADHGSVKDNLNGTFTITPEKDYNGEVKLSYLVSDGSASVAGNQTFTLAGVNDKALINIEVDKMATEDTDVTTDGFLIGNGVFYVVDPDAGEALLADGQSTFIGKFGSVTINLTDGNRYSYEYKVLNSSLAVQLLGESESATETFSLNSKDGTPLKLLIQIQGTADPTTGDSGDDVLYGTGGADSLEGNDGNDTIYGGDGNDALYGNDGNDNLVGGNGNDTLDGGPGYDYMQGGAGNDTYYVDTRFEPMSDSAGIDTVISSVDFTLGSDFEKLTLTGSQNLKGTGNSGSNVIHGNSGNNILDGSNGFDAIYGEGGNDTIYGGDQGDTLYGGAGDDWIEGRAGIDTIYGDGGKNSIFGGAGNDYIETGGGPGLVQGGDGNDTIVFAITSTGRLDLRGDGGADTFRMQSSSFDFSLDYQTYINDFTVNTNTSSSSDKLDIDYSPSSSYTFTSSSVNGQTNVDIALYGKVMLTLAGTNFDVSNLNNYYSLGILT